MEKLKIRAAGCAGSHDFCLRHNEKKEFRVSRTLFNLQDKENTIASVHKSQNMIVNLPELIR